jgi:cation:H+ antiporter
MPVTASDGIHEIDVTDDSIRISKPPFGEAKVPSPPMATVLALAALAGGVALIVVGAEVFAEHLEAASRRLGVSAFALALLLAGAEPEELATTVAASLRKVPAIAFGDVIGANIAMCLVALPVGALVAPLPFGPRVRRYALLALPLGVVAAAVAWNGRVGRPAGALLVALYVAYVAAIWIRERRPPALGEVAELADEDSGSRARPRRVGRELGLVLAGVAALVIGSVVLVEAIRSISGIESTQTNLSLTLVGLVTTLELVVLAWSSARRGITEAVIAAVVGSFAYNATMSLGAAALARPLAIADANLLRGPLVVMLAALAAVIALGVPRGRLSRVGGVALLAAYPLFVAYVAFR